MLAVTLLSPAGEDIDLSAVWPIGSVFTSTLSTNPAVLMGFGTWEGFGAGRVLVGIDPSDPSFDVALETGGAKTSSAVVNHNHAVTVNDSGHNHTQNAHTHVQNSFAPRIINSGTAGAVGVQGASGAANANASNAPTTATNQNATATNNASTTGITASTANPAGGVASFSLLNPYIVVYFWTRTE